MYKISVTKMVDIAGATLAKFSHTAVPKLVCLQCD